MTRAAAREGFRTFVDRAIEATLEEFSVSRALSGGKRGTTGAALDSLADRTDLLRERVVEPELAAHRDDVYDQFEVVLDYAAGEEPIESYRDRLLASGPFADALEPGVSVERRDSFHDALLAHHRQLGEAIAPLLDRPEDEFWPAVRAVYDAEVARETLTSTFAFTEPLLDHRSALELTTEIEVGTLTGGVASLLGADTVELEYTDEALRAMRHGERVVIRESNRTIDRRFGDEG